MTIDVIILSYVKNEDIFIHGDGTQIRAWCYVDDMVDGLMRCMTNPKAIGETFNIGNARAVTTIYGLANAVCKNLNSKSIIKFSGKEMADIELRVPDVSKAKSFLDFEATVDLDEGILETAKYYRSIN